MEFSALVNAIIATGGKQYNVSVGDSIIVEKLTQQEGEAVVFDQVLLLSDSENTPSVTVGTPTVKGVRVLGQVKAQIKDKKKIHYRYKNKTRSGIKRGHRQKLTNVVIDAIEQNDKEQQ